MAMGTPTLAFNRVNQDCSVVTDGLVKDDFNGFVLNYKDSNNLQDIVDKGIPLLNKIHTIDPGVCRAMFEQRFTADIMAKRYEYLYNKIQDGSRFQTLEIPF
jgi:glycosyltransferase involved in cell wall biosynthesis